MGKIKDWINGEGSRRYVHEQVELMERQFEAERQRVTLKERREEIERTLAQIAERRQEAEMQKNRGKVPETCPCEGCVFLRTNVGEAMLNYTFDFITEIRTAVAGGADRDAILTMRMEGPDGAVGSSFLGSMPRKQYSEFTFKLGEVVEEAGRSVLTEKPDLAVLRGEYGDDPVLMQLFEWIERRTM